MEGLGWFSTMDASYRDFIGAIEVNVMPTGDCDCFSSSYPFEESNIETGPCVEILNNCGYDLSTNYEIIINEKPDDGFILAESAMNAPGATYQPTFMPSSNHFQMKNDSNTELAMETIFEDSFGEGENGFFYTEKR
jgi:hypothetical protein